MAGSTGIEWTDATWNPIVGCSVKSPGCKHCYAMPMAARIALMGGAPHYAGLTDKTKTGPVFNGKVAQAPDTILTAPLRWKKPRRIFVNSMGDLFHESIPDEWILDVLTVMAIAGQHTFQVLTKRADRMRRFMSRPDLVDDIYTNWYAFSGGARELQSWPLPNVWLGVSTERQQEADERIPHLLQTPAAVRFISAEPLLGPINLFDFIGPWGPKGHPFQAPSQLDWVIVGGESGKNARPMHPDWARDLRDQCNAAGVPFFFKQWGEWAPDDGIRSDGSDPIMEGRARCAVWNGQEWSFHASGYEPNPFAGKGEWVYRLGKKKAGRLLDGKEHNAFPDTSAKARAA